LPAAAFLRCQFPIAGSMAVINSNVKGPTRSPVRKLAECDEIQPTIQGKTEPPNPLRARMKRASELRRARSKKSASAKGKIGATAAPSNRIAAINSIGEREATTTVAAHKAAGTESRSRVSERSRSRSKGVSARETRNPAQ